MINTEMRAVACQFITSSGEKILGILVINRPGPEEHEKPVVWVAPDGRTFTKVVGANGESLSTASKRGEFILDTTIPLATQDLDVS